MVHWDAQYLKNLLSTAGHVGFESSYIPRFEGFTGCGKIKMSSLWVYSASWARRAVAGSYSACPGRSCIVWPGNATAADRAVAVVCHCHVFFD